MTWLKSVALLLNSLVLVSAWTPIVPIAAAGDQSLSFLSQERVLFDEDFSKPLDEKKWKLQNMRIVDEVTTTAEVTSIADTTTVSNLTTDRTGATTTTEATPISSKVLVPIFDKKRPTHYGSLHRKIHLEAETRIVVEFKVKAVGYDMSMDHYFDPNVSELKKPFFHVQLVPKLREEHDTIKIFNFNVHGLNFAAKGWTTITFATTIDSKAAGNYTLQFNTRGDENPQVRGTFLKEVEMCFQPVPENNTEIRHDYYASTTTLSTTAATTTSTAVNATSTVVTETETPAPTYGRIMASRGAEIFVIFLVILLGIGLIALSFRHYKIHNKLREYKVNRSHGGPNFDNPTYSGDRTGR